MKITHTVSSCLVAAALMPCLASAVPDATPDPKATVVYLRSSCDIANSDPGESPMENCFESMPALRSWIVGSTTPPRTDPNARLLVDIGPGQFNGFSCPSLPHSLDVEFRGAGTGKTVIGVVFILECPAVKLSFRDLTVRNTSGNAVQWIGAGESNWHNVVLEGSLNAWYDKKDPSSDLTAICQPGENGTHRFFSSRLVTTGNATDESAVFLSWCGDSWFWGTELLFQGVSTTSVARGISARGPASTLHLYGSNIRVEAGASNEAIGQVTAIRVTDGADLHVHGTGIDTVGKAGWAITALEAASDGHIHANEASYFVRPDTGATFNRIVNNGGHIHAPYLWEHKPTFPLVSAPGADMTTTTSGTSDGQPHMLINSTSCATGWYDTTDKVCR